MLPKVGSLCCATHDTTDVSLILTDTVLYFGCRSASSDLFSASEWAHYRKLGARIEVAASRDQTDKAYVQHLIRRDKAMIKEWIVDRRGYIYISG